MTWNPPDPTDLVPEKDEADVIRPTDEELDAMIDAGNNPRFILDATELPF